MAAGGQAAAVEAAGGWQLTTGSVGGVRPG